MATPAASTRTTATPLQASSPAVRAAANAALAGGATHYTDRAGIARLRSAIAERLLAPSGLRWPAESVIVTAGKAEALYIALRVLIDPGDGVVLTSNVDRSLVEDLGGVALRAPDTGNGALLLGAADHARVLVVRDQAGDVQPQHTTGHLAALALAHALAVVAIVRFSPTAAPGPAATLAADPAFAGRVLVVGDFTAWGLEGWSVGFLAVGGRNLEAMIDLKQGITICTPAISQHAALAALSEAPVRATAQANARRAVTAATRERAAAAALAPARRATVADEGTRQRYELLDLLARTPHAISLGRGDPDLATPGPIIAAARRAIARGVDEPADPAGLPSLRRAISVKLAAQNGISVDPERELVVTTGGQEAIFLALQTILSPGDEILIPDPRYTAYDVAVNVCGARMVPVSCRIEDDFELDPDAVRALITPRTRALLVITPGNPTAAVAGAARLRAIAEIAAEHDLVVISDEIYERILYDGAEHLSIASLPGMAARTLTVNGFSKAFAMTGWRVGYIAGPARTIAGIAARKARWFASAPTVSQVAALAALEGPPALVDDALAEYAARRQITLEAIDRLGFPRGSSRGAFYVFFDVTAVGLSAYELSRRLLQEAGVFCYPGSGFGEAWSGYLRLAWLQPEPVLGEALERIARWLA
jgi:aminotransferase